MRNFTKNSDLLFEKHVRCSLSPGFKSTSVGLVNYFLRQRIKSSSFSTFSNLRLLIASLLSLVSIFASAQTTSWKGLSTTWSSSSNWTNGVPTANMDVIIGDANFTGSSNPANISSSSYFRSITIGGAKAASVSFTSNRTVTDVTINTNGTLTINKSIVTIIGDFVNNGTYVSTSSTGREIMGGSLQTISGSSQTTFKGLTINSGAEVTFNTSFTAPLTLYGTLIPNNTTHPKKSGTTTIKAGGTLQVNAALYATNYAVNPTIDNGGIVEYGGIINQTIESSIVYKSLVISGSGIKTPEATFTLSSAASTEGNVDVVSGTLDLSTFTINRAATGGGSFLVEDGAILKIGGTNSFPINYTTRTLEPASTVEYSGTSQTVTNLTYGNLIFSSSSGAAIKTLAAGALTIAGDFTSNKGVGTSVAYTAVAAISFGGNVAINASTSFTAGAFTHTVAGNWTNLGTFTNTSSTITFNGVVNQTINSTGAFNNVTVNKSAGKVFISTDVTINALTFTKGIIATGAYKVIITSTGNVIGAASTTGWVYGNLQRYFSAIAGGTFDVGGASNYSPIKVSFASVTAAGNLIASATPSTHPNIATSNLAYKNISRYWTVTKPTTGGITFTTANLGFSWVTTDNYSPISTAVLKVAKYTSAVWSNPTVTGTSTSTSINITSVTTFGDFAVGETDPCTISAGFSYSAIDYCANGGTAAITLNAGATSGVFTASPSGLLINSSTGTITLTGSAVGTYTVTNTATSGNCTTSSSFTLDVNPAPTATINYAGGTYCKTGANAVVTRTGTTGGTYSSRAGLSLNATSGTITLSTSTAGTYTVTYTVAASNGCSAFATTANVTIVAGSTASISYDGSPYCKNGGMATVTINGTTGGVYSSTAGLSINSSTGAINLSASTAGTYTVTYTLAASGGCTAYITTTDVTIDVTAPPTISYSGSPYCSALGSAAVTLVGTAGGSYTSTAGLVIDNTTGTIDLTTSTPGTYTVSYFVSPDVGCTATSTTSVTIKTTPTASISYSSGTFCTGAGSVPVTITGTTGGTFSSTTGLSISASTGAINATLSIVNTYTVTYTLSVNGCTSTATTSVTIAAPPSATISYTGNPFCNSGTAAVTRVGTAGGSYSSTAGLSLNASTGLIDLATSTKGTYTVTYTVSTNGCTVTPTTSVSISQSGLWSGALSTDWNNVANWGCNLLPTTTTNVVISGGLSNYPTIAGTQANFANNLTIASGARLTVDSTTLKIAGSISNAGTFTLLSGATIEFNGTSAQSIPANVFVSNTISNLVINNPVSVTVLGALNIIDLLTISNGTLYTNDFITLKSSVDNTARVDQITSLSATPIVGEVTVERYIPGRRKYRLIAPSVTTSTLATLPVGQESKSIWGNWQNLGDNSVQNLGTYVTGGVNTDGFDTQTINASIYTYNETTKKFVAFSSASGKNTKYTPLKAGTAFYMFVYGDRQNTITTSNPRPTTLKAKGTLAYGPQVFNKTSSIPVSGTVGNFTLLGNPYACTIDWKTVQKSGVSNTTWGWDANLNSTGGFVTVTATAGGATVSPLSGLVKVSRYIQPGQGYFVQTTSTNPTLTINEGNKMSGRNLNAVALFRTATEEINPSIMAINLLYQSAGVTYLADGAVVSFDSSFTHAVGEEDGIKMTNTAESVSTLEGSNFLSINGRPSVTVNDTIQVNMARLTKSAYTLEIFTDNFTDRSHTPYLQDNYLGTLSMLSLSDTNRIDFSVNTTIPASTDANRFSIVWKQVSTLPVTFTSIAATQQNHQVLVEWKVAQEQGIRLYEVERSTNGIDYSKVGALNATGNNVYRWMDVQPVIVNNFYRIKAIQNDGFYIYSKIAIVKSTGSETVIKVYPNPIKDQNIFVEISGIEKCTFQVSITNAGGQQVYTNMLQYNEPATIKINLDKKLPSGLYYLKIKGQGKEFSKTIFVE